MTRYMGHALLVRYRPVKCSKIIGREPVGETFMCSNDRFYIGFGGAEVDCKARQPVGIALVRECHSRIAVRQMLSMITKTISASRRDFEETVTATARYVATIKISREECRQ